MKFSKNIFNFFILIGSIILLIFLMKQISISQFIFLIKKLSFSELAVLVFLYVSYSILKGIRLMIVISSVNQPFKSISISMIHNFVNHVIPLRLGELSLPFLCKRFLKIDVLSSGVSLIIIRVYDVLILCFLFLSAVFLSLSQFESRIDNIFIYSVIAVLIVTVLVLGFINRVIDLFLVSINKIADLVPGRSNEILKKTKERIQSVKEDINAISRQTKFVALPLTTLSIWVLSYTTYFLVVRYLGVEISFIKNIIASSGVILANFLPVNGIGGFGTFEAGWSVGYMFWGMSKEMAIASGFILHFLIFATGLVTSLFSIAYLIGREKTKT